MLTSPRQTSQRMCARRSVDKVMPVCWILGLQDKMGCVAIPLSSNLLERLASAAGHALTSIQTLMHAMWLRLFLQAFQMYFCVYD